MNDDGSSYRVPNAEEISISSSVRADGLDNLTIRYNEALAQAYELGLLHGINAQSMAQAKNNVMTFEDYGWSVDD